MLPSHICHHFCSLGWQLYVGPNLAHGWATVQAALCRTGREGEPSPGLFSLTAPGTSQQLPASPATDRIEVLLQCHAMQALLLQSHATQQQMQNIAPY